MGVIRSSELAIERMRKDKNNQQGGIIVNIGSIAGTIDSKYFESRYDIEMI